MGRRPLPKCLAPYGASSFPTSISIPCCTCGISRPFGLLSPALGQVTNALLTRSPLRVLLLPVRLACIRHAASVHPEPGSNSPQNFYPSVEAFHSLKFDFLITQSLSTRLLSFFLSLFSC